MIIRYPATVYTNGKPHAARMGALIKRGSLVLSAGVFHEITANSFAKPHQSDFTDDTTSKRSISMIEILPLNQ